MAILWAAWSLLAGGFARGTALSIYDVQISTAQDDWRSPYEGEIVSLTGCVVTHIAGFRVVLQDPEGGDAWAGIEIRAFENEAPLRQLAVGDLVDLHDVYVEEFRGGTIPQFKSYSTLEIIERGHPLPEPIVVPLEELSDPPDRERCERYEGMLVAVENVRIGEMDWGKAEDNYQLVGAAHAMWASDYVNLDLAVPPFPKYYVERGERYARISGIFQEYLHPPDGWDYYQLLPRGTADYVRSSLYTIRDVQESDGALDWASSLLGSRIDLQGIVASRRNTAGWLAIADPALQDVWSGILVRDPGAALATLAVGDDVRLGNVLVIEEDGTTELAFDATSSVTLEATGSRISSTTVSPDALARQTGPESAEAYEGMLITVRNAFVARRGIPEGSDLYYVAAGEDTLLATDITSTVLAPDSSFFVREGDHLGHLRGIVAQRGAAYVIHPRGASDYGFVTGGATYTTWGNLKGMYR